MRRIWILMVWMVVGVGPVLPQGNPRSEIEQAIGNLELDRAAVLSFKQSDEKLRNFYQARILFIRYLLHEDAALLTSFLDLSRRALDALQELPDTDPERDLLAAELFFLRGAVKAMDKKNVSSAFELKNACTLLYRNSQRFPNNREQMKLLGIFNVAMSAIPKKLKWLGSVLCFTGNLEQGLRQLETAAKESKLLPQEASLMLFYFEKNLLGKPDLAVARAQRMVDANPNSIMTNYLLLSGYLETRQIDAAIALVQEKEARLMGNPQVEDFPAWYYSRGKVHFYRLEYEECIRQMDKFLALYSGKTLYADALYKKAMALVLEERYEDARPVFHQLTKAESSGFDVDEYALSQAAIYLLRAPNETEKQLYAARNLFDGGYYQRSIKTLMPIEAQAASCTENERCELWYRLGRNWQELDSARLARGCYVACISTQPGRSLWMKAYSHYYLGRLEEEEKHYDIARREYQIALSYDNYDYQSGLEQRCKAALEQLKGKK
jgi:tetratricopeptide (TPR) repeat protein